MVATPYYRAKRKDGNDYVIGWLIPVKNSTGYFIRTINEWVDIEIDPTTLAIHFPGDMIDSQGNKIFASLSGDGKGGDIMRDDEYYGIAKYKDCEFVVEYENVVDNIYNGNFEVIGIQQ